MPSAAESSSQGTSSVPSQIHLALGPPNALVAAWAGGRASTLTYWPAQEPHQKRTATGKHTAHSLLMYLATYLIDPPVGMPAASLDELQRLIDVARQWARDPTTGSRPAELTPPALQLRLDALADYRLPSMYYNSPALHAVTIPNLAHGTTYEYRVDGDNRTFAFTTPPPRGGGYPFTMGLAADLGQTAVSAANIHFLRAVLAAHTGSVCLIAGDLAYADGYYPLWDSFGRMLEPLAARVPLLTTGGNHEVDYGEAWVSYTTRYPMPFEASGSSSPLWWSRDVGPVHIVSLCSYADASAVSLQYEWLLRDFAGLDREATPWLVVMLHVPWYSSAKVHTAEGELMRRGMEPLFYAVGVDLVVTGHVHAYERTVPVFEAEPNDCGPVHVTLGDGGNREGTVSGYREPPPWSAFREPSFGAGWLTIKNSTHARFHWRRTGCESANGADHIDLNASCYVRLANGAPSPTPSSPDSYSALSSDGSWLVRSPPQLRRADRRVGCKVPMAGWPSVAPRVQEEVLLAIEPGRLPDAFTSPASGLTLAAGIAQPGMFILALAALAFLVMSVLGKWRRRAATVPAEMSFVSEYSELRSCLG